MSAVKELLVVLILLYGTGFSMKHFDKETKKMFIKRFQKGFSSTEAFSNRLTGQKTPF
jgi:hypothetical protein